MRAGIFMQMIFDEMKSYVFHTPITCICTLLSNGNAIAIAPELFIDPTATVSLYVIGVRNDHFGRNPSGMVAIATQRVSPLLCVTISKLRYTIPRILAM